MILIRGINAVMIDSSVIETTFLPALILILIQEAQQTIALGWQDYDRLKLNQMMDPKEEQD